MTFFNPVIIAADATLEINTTRFGGFLAVTAGTLTVQFKADSVKVIDAFPVAAGQVIYAPISLGRNEQATVQFICAGGASGTLLV
jgi:hypothetical protein